MAESMSDETVVARLNARVAGKSIVSISYSDYTGTLTITLEGDDLIVFERCYEIDVKQTA